MSRASSSALRTRNAMEVLAVMEFVRKKALLCWESALWAKWKTHAWTISASRRLHPWFRIPVVLATDAVSWVLLAEVGISLVLLSLAWVYFYGMLLFAPFLSVLFWLLSYFVPPLLTLSHPPPYLTTIFAACSISIFCILSFIRRRTRQKDPTLELGDFMTSSLLRLPSFQQLVLGYTVFSLGSAFAAVLTVDVLLSIYWSFFGTFYSIEICCLMLYRLPWYVFISAGVALPVVSIGLLRKCRSSRELAVEGGRQMFQQGNLGNLVLNLPV